ncbi:restriction endonuclease subunit S [Aureimonas populi]|uniref:Restriction endonuclease subunit S n=1 Tax=Aureimonas populi TaxID=1701758 RepID=A0ABW5CIP4_9HYPH|nr:restriction endonuclease subunit S [Aureimonas populi]
MSFWSAKETTELRPLKYLARFNPEVLSEDTNPDFEFDYIDIGGVTLEDGVRHKETMRFETAPSRARKPVRSGDVIVSTVRTYLKAVARIDETHNGAIVSTGFAVLRPNADVDAGYLYRLCQANAFVSDVEARSTGVSYPAINPSALAAIKVPFPDLATQKAIAAFLDREAARIDKLIAKKERQVELLLQKSASWLDDLTFGARTATPGQLVPFKWICRIPNGQVDPTDPDWADLPLVAPNHIEQGTGRLLYTETAREQGADSGKYAFPADTVVYSKIRPNLAKACIVPHAGLCSADMYPIIPAARLRPMFLLMQLLSRKFTDWATTESMRVAMPKINRETIGTFRLLVPPIEIQDQAIGTYLTVRKCIEDGREAIIQSLSLLREHRAALITAAVAGQIDIRENLPAVTSTSDRDRFRLVVGAEIIHRLPDNPKRARVKVHKITYLAETHLGIDALRGNYLREAAGPLDRALREETERSLEAAGYYRANQTDGTGTAVTYSPLAKAGQHKAELATLLGSKAEALRKLIAMLADLDRRATEAVATLYAVWNDALIDGETPDDAAIINGVLHEWHTEKGEKFTAADLNIWLAWMRRRNLIPRGQGPRTTTGRLFV